MMGRDLRSIMRRGSGIGCGFLLVLAGRSQCVVIMTLNEILIELFFLDKYNIYTHFLFFYFILLIVFGISCCCVFLCKFFIIYRSRGIFISIFF